MDKTLFHNQKMHDVIADVYDLKHQEIYNEIEQTRLWDVINELLAKHPNRNNVRVLDYGAGTGNLAIKFLNSGCCVMAVDPSIKSLEILRNKAGNRSLETQVLRSQVVESPDGVFDIVCAYSVIHHIQDYVVAVKEMLRVLKPGGVLYIDHEANQDRYKPNDYLAQYNAINKQTISEHLLKLLKTGELFSWGFIKTAFYKLFIDRRYEREGDIHVWKDDHVEWNEIN